MAKMKTSKHIKYQDKDQQELLYCVGECEMYSKTNCFVLAASGKVKYTLNLRLSNCTPKYLWRNENISSQGCSQNL